MTTEEKATKKQLQFISLIEDALGYSFDYVNGTKKEASKYISSHIDEYREKYEELKLQYADNWALSHGYF